MAKKWKARLSGDEWDLEGLTLSFAQARHRVTLDEGCYLLTSPDLAACQTEHEAWEAAERIIQRMNRAAKISEPGFRPVRVQGLFQVAPDGAQLQHIVAKPETGRIVFRERVTMLLTRADGTVEVFPDSSLGPDLMALQEREGSDGTVAAALEQWDLPEQSPTSLNNILEIIRNDWWGGGAKGAEGQAWGNIVREMAPLVNMSEAELDDKLRRCRNSFQDPASVGPLARHPHSRKVDTPMNLDRAQSFVRSLLLGWLQSKV